MDEVWAYVKLFVVVPVGIIVVVSACSLVTTGKLPTYGDARPGYCGSGPTSWEC